MKSVLISIQPKWCGLISDGKKTVEVRKTAPKLKPPFKCYIYCTMPKTKDPHQVLEVHGADGKIRKANGKVIGEFVCDDVLEFTHDPFGNHEYFISDDEIEASCLNAEDLWCYGKGKTLYGWHISNLVVYAEPKELLDFGIKRPPQSWCYAIKEDKTDHTLKSCPFCGGEAHLNEEYGYFEIPAICCEGCDSVFALDDCEATAEEVVKSWNNRATHTEVHQYGENCTHISNCGTLNLNL